jgi:excisionase family DNA binding protein
VTQLFTLQEAAAILRVSVRTVQRLIGSGQIRPTRIGRRTLITEQELDAYAAAAFRSAA